MKSENKKNYFIINIRFKMTCSGGALLIVYWSYWSRSCWSLGSRSWSDWSRDLCLSLGLVCCLLRFWLLVDVYGRSDSLVDDDGRLVVLAGCGDVDWVRLGGRGVLLWGRGRSLVALLGRVLRLVRPRLLGLWWTGKH